MRQSRQVTSRYCPGTTFLNCPTFLLYILIEDHFFYSLVYLAKLNSHGFLSISILASYLPESPHALFVKYIYIIIINIYRKYQVTFKYIFMLYVYCVCVRLHRPVGPSHWPEQPHTIIVNI